ncbi:hypothetical protein [Lactiplantibacillus fabifermentans]|uniref:Uncharacterized protein n=2 Tax=Lactiplantibacillus fabifermentans TaxID=483011 RepID=A0A0R2NR12_9LACO|nr:hypothetical protein [Lactiplantibacillus fabifermentans]ETY74166.1 hypothetical protein LFAB_08535 [Lactiplantibacillus fabifermentans T30PCM01]KRO28150.1 hypothetical protein DY78_GL002648 [Lactiplantibacillus fabifermentans DSM 21115]
MILVEKIYRPGHEPITSVDQIAKFQTNDGYITPYHVLAREIGADKENCFYKNSEGKRKKVVATKDAAGTWQLKTIGSTDATTDGLLSLPRMLNNWGD